MMLEPRNRRQKITDFMILESRIEKVICLSEMKTLLLVIITSIFLRRFIVVLLRHQKENLFKMLLLVNFQVLKNILDRNRLKKELEGKVLFRKRENYLKKIRKYLGLGLILILESLLVRLEELLEFKAKNKNLRNHQLLLELIFIDPKSI